MYIIPEKGVRFLLLSFTFVLLTLMTEAQQTLFFIDRESAFKKGTELFDEKNYLGAREKFEEIYNQPVDIPMRRNEVLMQNLEYYIAVCATEVNDKDAELLLLSYYTKYHETDKRRLIYFYLGKYYYNNKQYGEAVTYFSKVNIADLSNEQIYEYKFQLGYSYFTKKKFNEAKPLFASIKDIKDKYFYPSTYYYGFISFYNKDYNEALSAFTGIEDSKMYASVIPYYIAQIYYFKKDYSKVESHIKKNIDRSDVLYKDEMKFLLGQVYFQKSEYAKALPLLNEYVSRAPKAKKEDIYQLAYCQYQTGDYNKAVENFKQLNILNEALGQNATYALGDCYLKLNQKEKARSAFQSAALMNYDEDIREHSLFNYAKLSFELGYSTEAIQSLEAYIEKYPSGTYADEGSELLAAALVQTKNYDRAYKIMERLKLSSALIKEAYQKVTYFRAIELFNDKNLDEALVLCDKSLKHPIQVEIQALAIYLKAEILYQKADYDEALQLYLRFAQYATPALEKKSEASKLRALYNAGYCYFKKKNYSDAAVYYGNAVSESATSKDMKGKNSILPDLYLRYADCNFVTKNYSKAVDAYATIVERKWSSAVYAQYQKGIILGLQNKDEEKVAAMNYLINNFPSSNYTDQAYFEIGETYLQKNNLNGARSSYQSIIQKIPNSPLLPKCFLKIAVIDYNSGKKELSAESYKTVVKKFPETREARESLDALKDLYVEMGKADDYFEFVKNNSKMQISSSEQDSLTYQSADNAYNANDCIRAVTLFGNYISKFPQGFFTYEAHWKKADCHIKSKEYSAALSDFESIILNKYSRYYEKALLNASGIAYYEQKDYQRAGDLYRLLYLSSTSAQNTYTSMVGLLRSSVKMKSHDDIIEHADRLINSGVAKDADLQEALYEKAKALYNKGDQLLALDAFNRVTEMPVSEKAVESKYMVAKILYEQQNYKNSLDTCFRLKNKYSSYEYWIAKTFVLIAENYYAQGNSFQAKATLESIVENYEGDAAILNEAKSKLEKIRAEELNKSRIMETPPTDTLIMETDSLINR